MSLVRKRVLVAFACAVALVGACDKPIMTAPEPAYDPEAIVPFLYHWRAGHVISIYVDRTDEPADANLAEAVDNAIAAWTAVGLLGEIRLRTVSNVHDADVIVHHYRAPRLFTSEECPPFSTGAGGQTFFCVSEDSQVVPLHLNDGTSGPLRMDVAINRFALDTASFFPALVAHELGHVLGIGAHSPDASDLMNGRPRRLTPSSADAATLRYVLARRPEVIF